MSKKVNVSNKINVKIKTMYAFLAPNERIRKKVESALHYVGVKLKSFVHAKSHISKTKVKFKKR